MKTELLRMAQTHPHLRGHIRQILAHTEDKRTTTHGQMRHAFARTYTGLARTPKFESAVASADMLMWIAFAEQFPEATSGDSDANTEEMLREVADIWLVLNVPGAANPQVVERLRSTYGGSASRGATASRRLSNVPEQEVLRAVQIAERAFWFAFLDEFKAFIPKGIPTKLTRATVPAKLSQKFHASMFRDADAWLAYNLPGAEIDD